MRRAAVRREPADGDRQGGASTSPGRSRPRAPAGAVRDAHAKGYGLSGARSRSWTGSPPSTRRASTPHPGRHGALIRFSNGSPHAGADARLGTSIGLALKMFDIEGPTLLEDEPDTRTFDYTNINGPIFFCNTVEHYLFIQDLFLQASDLLRPGPTRHAPLLQRLRDREGNVRPGRLGVGRVPGHAQACSRPAGQRCCCRATGRWARCGTETTSPRYGSPPTRTVPRPSSGAPSTRRRRRRSSGRRCVAELKERPYAFDIQVQLCTDLERMPVEDLTVEWPERALAVRHGGQAPHPAAGHLRRRTTSRRWTRSRSHRGGSRPSTPPRQPHAGTQGGLPPLLAPAPRAQPPEARRAAQRGRGAAPHAHPPRLVGPGLRAVLGVDHVGPAGEVDQVCDRADRPGGAVGEVLDLVGAG